MSAAPVDAADDADAAACDADVVAFSAALFSADVTFSFAVDAPDTTAAAPGVNDFAALNRGANGAVGDYLSGSEKNMDADGAITILTLIQGILSNLQQLQS